MRVYKSDGSFVEDINDIEFGWFLGDIVIDESVEKFEEINRETRYISKMHKSRPKFCESIDISNVEEPRYIKIKTVEPNVEVVNIIDTCRNDDLPSSEELARSVDVDFPPKQKLIEMINPYNAETRMLLSVISFAKYKSLMADKTDLMNKVNVRTTNYKNLLFERSTSVTEDMIDEIVNYHANKEDNMMSLMMELILTDVDCDDRDVLQQKPVPQILPQFIITSQTSDLGNSLPNGSSSEGETRNNYLQVSNRSDILNSLGLSDEDKSIQSFCDETFEMHQELADIKKSFQEDENKVNDLLKQACALKNDLRETLYLNDIINLLEGHVEKVKLKKLPFRIFNERMVENSELNLII
ncbi:unnamed protein product [Phyllotreta striolata]|uniref:Uncharacterized protein n=1 Tax=Phyllotreta striolata TaxID=444603 RepID=A0A9N9TY19_PHYSR|nr:unnamed protein product [Phyllotreta striolata]